ncbi:phenylalanine--tRNA ligase subunit beta [Candidatus Kuenenbacteria bacterium CG_4_9_14_3_um_filter_39_14]|uniref:Phenylalanine--tRNA ligase beta subunit n=7 Tax=Candidatus Kueneniibacteriota TaxID=1752740 RepID=A0A2M7MI38_9BACT|nr:MAG: phenylalanine--tRNA ligase subunit beta [Candidatus Kuenenbacteria bacterium CG2_30_39_24]PIX92772.1 MAG: phenylalanine--tRNA ligase subunit beta [Candidatus Kuenenbacteria bacterium CG_4_10_14_3_um_filter_39_14]PJA91844.1 MAG: phenylalanine--tRNA ligase subunit beta [Candidatus Kuenenbacteria bacterium CG_4_9_14_3_um_filter_39_14]
MLVSYNLLKKYVDLPPEVSPQAVAEKLTMATVEVEQVIELGTELDKVVVGKVKNLAKHSQADKLSLAWVDIGAKEVVKVVCGGTNLKEGMLVALALPGAKIRWHGQGEPLVLEKAKIRGEESFGMICSANEIGLYEMFPHQEFEIMDLSGLKLKVGQPLAQALGLAGIVFDIDNKSLTNRPDLWSHFGIARELSAIYQVPLKGYDFELEPDIVANQSKDLRVEIKERKLCPRYLGCVIENVKIGESPDWLKKELLAMGHSVINNIVDVTNYVMEEVGQPLHAFDLALLGQKLQDARNNKQGTRLIIRRAKKGEKLALLDESELALDDEMLVIADSKKPVALAGIMGGRDSGINERTTAIVLEAANFEAANNRRTAQKLNIRTDSSQRFEKSLDAHLAAVGMRRAIKLIKELMPAAKVSPIVEAGNWQEEKNVIKVSHDFLERRIGRQLEKNKVLGILNRLGFEIDEQGGVYSIIVPGWRATGDVSIAEDIVEEVARIDGYDNLNEKEELVALTAAKYQPEYDLENKVKNYLSVGCGMNEVFNYPWADEKLMERLGLKGEVGIANPPAGELGFLQTSLVPNLIKNIQDNLRFLDNFKIFELARVYTAKMAKWDKKMADSLPYQPKHLAGAVVTGKNEEPFRQVKGILEEMFNKLQITNYKLQINPKSQIPNFINSVRRFELVIGGDVVGWLGEVDYNQLNFKNKKVALFEINWEKIIGLKPAETKYQSLPQHPSIERDIAIEVDWPVKWADIEQFILTPRTRGKDLMIQDVSFLSEYPLENKKSLAFRIVYQADRTLTNGEVEPVEAKIIKLLETKFKAKLRQ